jgi:hypothetical protein
MRIGGQKSQVLRIHRYWVALSIQVWFPKRFSPQLGPTFRNLVGKETSSELILLMLEADEPHCELNGAGTAHACCSWSEERHPGG